MGWFASVGGAGTILQGDIIGPAVNEGASPGEETELRLEVRPHVRRQGGTQWESLEGTTRQKI